MRNFLVSLFVVFGLLIIGGLMFIYSGLFDVAANDPDWSVMRWGLQTTRMRSIKFHAAGIQVPAISDLTYQDEALYISFKEIDHATPNPRRTPLPQ